MGLDTVELLMDLEEEFEIEIPDDHAQQMATVGEIAKYVCKYSKQELTYEIALRKIIGILVKNYGVPEGKAISSSHIVYDLGLE